MFGPNVKADERGIYYHHREEMFHTILQSLEIVFQQRFGLEDYRFLFLTGSGTMANEAVIFSSHCCFHYLYTDAEFGRRLKKMGNVHQRTKPDSGEPCVAFPLYETSISRLNWYTGTQPMFLDLVSAFPYFMPPSNTLIWTTVSSKQLGSYPVLGIVAIRRDVPVDKWFDSHDGSSLNLRGHLLFRERRETHFTPALPLYYDLLQRLMHFNRQDFIKKIDERRRRVTHYLGVDNIIGSGPVVTFRPTNAMIPIVQKFNLYQSSAGCQLFLWSGTDEEYEAFYHALEKV